MAYLDRKPNRTMQITVIAIVAVLQVAAFGALWSGLDLSRVFAPGHAQSKPAADSPDALPAQPATPR